VKIVRVSANMYLSKDFPKFSVNKFKKLIKVIATCSYGCVISKLEGESFVLYGGSLMHRSGSRIEPGGTPVRMASKTHSKLSTETNCCPSTK
jgi:hypothetical protein